MKRLFKNIICAVLAPVALVSCMDLDENVYDKLPTDEFGTTEKQINAIMAPVSYTHLTLPTICSV